MTDLPVAIVWGLKATPLLLAAWMVTALLRRASASSRHFVWVLALGATLVLPLVAGIAPRVEVRLPGLPAADRLWDASGLPVADVPAAGAVVSAADAPIGVALPSAPRAVSTPPASSPPAAPVGVVWLVGAGAMLLAIGISLWRTSALARSARPVAHVGVAREAAALARHLGIRRPVAILQARDEAMPMTWGARRPRVLVPVGFVGWPAARRQAVLLHELAHVKRWDWLTQLAARFACALYWWHPLVWVAARRLREERELACDDLVLAQGTVPSAYAGDLLEIARSLRPARATAMAGVAMARRSQLAGRLLAVLDAARPRRALAPPQAMAAAAAALLAMVPVAGLAPGAPESGAEHPPVAAAPPAPAPPGGPRAEPPVPAFRRSAEPPARRSAQAQGALLCTWAAPSDRNSSSSSINDDRMMIQIARDDCWLTVRAEGEVTFTDDDRDVARLSRGGFFEIEERTRGGRRRVEVALANDRLERRWFVEGGEQPYGDDARAWFGDALLVVMRRAGINAEARAIRILETQGEDALIAEIGYLQSDHVAGRYYRVLFERGRLSSAQVARLLADAARHIDSDHELGRVLAAVAARGPLNAEVQGAYVRATDALDSDHEHGQALEALVAAADLDLPALDAMLASAGRIDSDYQRARVLISVAERYPPDRPLPATYLDAVGDMESDHERGRVLGQLVGRQRLSGPERARVLGVVRRIDSDHTQSQLLLSVIAQGGVDDATREAFFAAVGGIESDHNRQQVLTAVVAAGPDEPTTLAVLAAAREIDSDHSKGEVLMAVAQRGAMSDRVRAAFLTAARSIDSRHTRERVFRAAGLEGA